MKKRIIIVLAALLVSSCILHAGKPEMTHTLQKLSSDKALNYYKAEFSLDGKYFLTWHPHHGTQVWRAKDSTLCKEAALLNNPEGGISGLGANFTGDSKSVYTGFDNGMAALIDLDTGKIKRYDFKVERGSVAENEKSAISSSGKILALSGKYINTENHLLGSVSQDADSGLAITSDDKYIISAWLHGCVNIGEVATGKVSHWCPPRPFRPVCLITACPLVSEINVSPDNDTIAAGVYDGDVWLYSIRHAKKIGCLSQTGYDLHPVFSPDGKKLLTYGGNVVTLWDVASQKRERKWKTNHPVRLAKWLRGTPWIAIVTRKNELIIESVLQEETIFRGNFPPDITSVDYNPINGLLLLCVGGSVDLYKIK